MRKGLLPILLIAVSCQTVIWSAPAGGVSTCLRAGCEGWPTLVPTFGADISPRGLPRHEYTPATAHIFGKIKTSDGTHPSAFREAVVDIDKDVKINVKGYPVCKSGQLQARDTKSALKVCGDAVVGAGTVDFAVAPAATDSLVEPRKAFGDLLIHPLTVFNGGESGGKVKLLIHSYFAFAEPGPAAVVGVLDVTRRGRGLHAVARTPVVSEGAGSLIDFSFKLGKTYSYKGKKVGYFEAKCPDGVFKVNVPKVLFKNEAHTPGVAATTSFTGRLKVPCAPTG